MANNYKVGTEITVDSKKANENLDELGSSFEYMIDQAEEASKALDEVGKSSEDTSKAIDKADDATKKADKSTKDWSKTLDNLGKNIRNFGKDFSLYVTAPITAFAGLAVKEFMNAEKELNQLNIALRNSGNFSKAAVEQFKALADELERTTNFSGGAVTMASAMALNFTKTSAEAERLVRAATDLSEATGVSLDQAVQSLGMSLNGVSGALARTIPEVRNLTEEQLRAGEAIRLVENRFKGSALEATKNLTGEVTRLKNGFLAFASDIGSQLAPYVQVLVRNLNELLDYLRNLDPVVRNTAIGIGLLVAAIGPLSIAIGGFIKFLPILKSGFTALITGVKGFLVLITGPVGMVAAIAGLVFAVAGFINLFLELKAVTGNAGQAFVLTWRWVASQFESYVIKPILKQLQNLYDVLAKIPKVGFIFSDASNFVGGFIDGINRRAGEIDDEVAKVFEGTGKTAAGAFTFGLNETFANFKDQLKNAFSLPVVKELDYIVKETEKKTKQLTDFQKELAKGVRDNVVGNFTNAFSEISNGTKSVSDAFGDMVNSIIQDLTRLVLQRSLTQALTSMFPASLGSSGAGVATGGYVNNGTITHRYAQGGLVRGPGTGTSDSINARLSNGEFVNDAKTVSFFSPEFFLGLKRMARSVNKPSPILNGVPGFANGGLVSGMGSGETRIVIQNSGSPKEASGVTTEQDAQGMVVNIILEDIQKNGSISKSFQTNYGLKRGGI